MALWFEYTDAAAADAVVVLDVVGRNQFGESVEETVTLSTAAGLLKYTSHCYSYIASITPTTLTQNLAADNLSCGSDGTQTAAMPIPLPFKPKTTDCVQAVSIDALQWDSSELTVSKVYHTVTLTTDNSWAGDHFSIAAISFVLGGREAY
jgi:hypothetical protein